LSVQGLSDGLDQGIHTRDDGIDGRNREQLWAEAAARYREGAIWWFEEPELVASAKAEQDQRYHADAWDAPSIDDSFTSDTATATTTTGATRRSSGRPRSPTYQSAKSSKGRLE